MSDIALITISEAREMLRYNDSSNDVRLSLMIEAASLSILRYIKSDGEEYRDSSGEFITGNVEGDIKMATAALVGILDRSPDGNEDKIFEPDVLPAPVEALLHSRRDPTIA